MDLSAVGVCPFQQKGPTCYDSYTDVLRTPNRFHARSPRAADRGVVLPESQVTASFRINESVLETDLRRETSAIRLPALSAFAVFAAPTVAAAADRPGDR